MQNLRKVGIVDGVRTPFVKAGTAFSSYNMQQLGAHALSSLISKSGLDPASIDECIFSTVLLDPRTPNWAREILFMAGLPKTITAHAVSNNCISGLVAAHFAALHIAQGEINIAIAGGSESMSNPTLVYNKRITDAFLQLSRARSFAEKLKAVTRFRLSDLLPSPPAITEPSTGLTMGQHMELTAQAMGIARADQDAWAAESHHRAAAATADGRLTAEIAALGGVEHDQLIRKDTSVERLAKLAPVFDRSGKGTLTAGNSSALTDGASAVLLMSQEKASQLGQQILAYIADVEYAAIAPADGLLMAPAVAVPRLLQRRGLRLEDFDLIEIHEAFAAQVLANVRAWEEGWKESAVGKIDWSKVNVMGGSVAIGHPFAATGGRILTSLAHEMQRRDAKRALISICAAGAMACAMILER